LTVLFGPTEDCSKVGEDRYFLSFFPRLFSAILLMI
jgi:hypothetical protein